VYLSKITEYLVQKIFALLSISFGNHDYFIFGNHDYSYLEALYHYMINMECFGFDGFG